MRECRNLPIAISVAGTEIHSKSNAHFPFFASRSIFLDWPHIWISFSSLSQYLSPSVRFGLVRLVCVFFSVLHFLILEAMSARTTKSLVIIIVHRYKTKSKMSTKCEQKGDREREKDRTRYGQNDDYIHTYVYMYRLWWTHTIIIIQYKRSY